MRDQSPAKCCTRLGGLQLARGELAVTGITLELVAETLTFVDGAEARTFHRRSMDEHVRAAFFRLDETETLLPVEPLNRADSHVLVFLVYQYPHTPNGARNQNFEVSEGQVRNSML